MADAAALSSDDDSVEVDDVGVAGFLDLVLLPKSEERLNLSLPDDDESFITIIPF